MNEQQKAEMREGLGLPDTSIVMDEVEGGAEAIEKIPLPVKKVTKKVTKKAPAPATPQEEAPEKE